MVSPSYINRWWVCDANLMSKKNDDPYVKKHRAWTVLRSLLYDEPVSTEGDIEDDGMDVLSFLDSVDYRLRSYMEDLASDAYEMGDDCNTMHNYYEICCGLRFLKLLDRYEFDVAKVRRVIRLREGVWRQDGRRWHHVSGGIPQPTSTGRTFFRWEPFQVFVLASVFGFYCYVDTGARDGDRVLLPTETVIGGVVYDRRRLCTEFTLYAPRKVDKTGMSAFVQVVFFLMEDYNAQVYCCANSADQSKTLYTRTRGMLEYLNRPHRFHITATVCDWLPEFRHVRDAQIVPLSAGAKTKDGLQAQLCCADEYGSAAWVRDHSDMKSLVDVIQSSMGPRREPLTFVSTTAGNIVDGPFVQILDGLHRLLNDK